MAPLISSRNFFKNFCQNFFRDCFQNSFTLFFFFIFSIFFQSSILKDSPRNSSWDFFGDSPRIPSEIVWFVQEFLTGFLQKFLQKFPPEFLPGLLIEFLQRFLWKFLQGFIWKSHLEFPRNFSITSANSSGIPLKFLIFFLSCFKNFPSYYAHEFTKHSFADCIWDSFRKSTKFF